MKRTSVTIRQRKATGGRMSLYLDIYDQGERKTESLQLYLLPGDDKQARYHNRATMEAAEIIRSQRLGEVQSGGLRPVSTSKSLLDYIIELEKTEGPYRSPAVASKWRSLKLHLIEFWQGKKPVTLEQLTTSDVEKFKHYLQHMAKPLNKSTSKILGRGTARSIFSHFLMMLKRADAQGLLRKVDFFAIKPIPAQDSVRLYLTEEELHQLASTPCGSIARKYFLFSCFTGLRTSDRRELRWSDFFVEDGYLRFAMRTKKTGYADNPYITAQAQEIIGWNGQTSGYVFEKTDISQESLNKALRAWVARAGIHKKITMHCARHTFATMLLTKGADIYTVSKMLGHRNVGTTQVYAKVVDELKKKAALSFPQILGEITKKSL